MWAIESHHWPVPTALRARLPKKNALTNFRARKA